MALIAAKTTIKINRIARFSVPNLKIPKKVVSKLSSIEYDVLQSKLAFYGKHEEDLKLLFKKWNLNERHP